MALSREGADDIEALRLRLLQVVVSDRDVVLDLSFWSWQMPEDYRRLLTPTGVVPESVYLAADRETVRRRLGARRGRHADDVVVAQELAAEYFDHFEPPTRAEGPLTVVAG